jgi:nucleoside-diphosphate-sugar epimerase
VSERSVLIAGATGGIGRAVAKELAGAGLRLGLMGRNSGRLEQTRYELGLSDDACKIAACEAADIGARLAGRPPAPEEIRPVIIGDGVWIGTHRIIFPGVKVGESSVISTGSVVRTHAIASSDMK